MTIEEIESKSPEEILALLNSFRESLETEKRYHATLDHMMEGFQIIDFDYRYKYVNNTVVAQSKHQREELIGCTMMEKYPGIENTEMFKVLEECMKNRTSRNFINEFTFPDGSKAWFELSMQPCAEGLFILSMDITDRKRAEIERKLYIKDLEQMIFMTSHRVRQPVAHILGVSYLLDKSMINTEELKKTVDYMRKAAESLDEFTRELTSFIGQIEAKVKKGVETAEG